MVLQRGEPWGEPGALPHDGLLVRSDAEARAVVEEARRARAPVPVLGLLGGDLCRTLGGTGDAGRLRSAAAMTFACDLGAVLVDGRMHWFVAHLVARRRLWRGRIFLAMNAAFLGPWNVGPKAHPGDGLLDTYEATLSMGDALKARARLPVGAHLPHPAIQERRVPARQVDLPPAAIVRLDGAPVGPARSLSIRAEPGALTVVV